MSLQILDTLTREKRPFEPIVPGKVGIYVCGVTVYDDVHVGHARAAIAFDVVHRWLVKRGYAVTFVRNFTDVDDKIIKRAQERGVISEKISEEYIAAYRRDMGQLGLLEVAVEPRATQTILEMQEIIKTLIAKGLAYEKSGDVYFHVPAWKPYGKLSRRKLDEQEPGARVEVDANKKDPADFALWKSAKPGEPKWPSPWGEGRPGWHIECSAMAMKYLGQPIDIHGGGEDLIFPHHENEIAQSEGAFEKPFARYWMHNAFVKMNSEKMSKSLGNVIRLRDALEQHGGEVVRFFCLQAHYRSPIDFTDANIAAATQGLGTLYRALGEADRALGHFDNATVRIGPAEDAADLDALAGSMEQTFGEQMDNDFNTAGALAVVFTVANGINRLASRPSPTTGDVMILERLRKGLAGMTGDLGLLWDSPPVYFERLRARALAASGVSQEQVEAKVAERDALRKAKKWKDADGVKEWLRAHGIEVEDGPKGTTWRRL